MKEPQYEPEEGLVKKIDFLNFLLEKVKEEAFPLQRKRDYGEEILYYNIPSAFDIETTSFYNDKQEKCACMYVWTFGIYNKITYGRTWSEFFDLLSYVRRILSLSKEVRLVIYIHNFSFEWGFMRRHLNWDKVFFIESRKPIYALTSGIEFRDSLRLSNKSLANTARDIVKYPIKKMLGDLDYSQLRHSKTPLSLVELKYCENDVRILLHYIQEKIENDRGIAKIPLTLTGYVRNYCRYACYGYGKKNKKWRNYNALMNELILTAQEYLRARDAFQGGYTHAASNRIGLPEKGGKIHRQVYSRDISSSYPTVMITRKFPMSSAVHYDTISEDELIQLTKSNCLMFNVRFTKGLIAKPGIPDYYISVSKTNILKDKLKAIVFNGRLFGTEEAFNYYCTEQDYFIIKECYAWIPNTLEITDIYAYEAGYLPRPLIKSVINFYKDKTTLKGLSDRIVDYMVKKNMLNSTYGMMVTAIVRDIIKYIDDKYVPDKPDLEKSINKYNKSPKRFLFYPWGVWVTAYARANLWAAILELGEDYIYSDTDSVKFQNPDKHEDFFNHYNDELWKLVERAANYHKISIQDLKPVSHGQEYPIGFWDDDGVYDKFKTLGAKRYFIKYPKNKPHIKLKKKFSQTKLHIINKRKPTKDWLERKAEIIASTYYQLTVAGVGKKSACIYLVKLGLENHKSPFDFFNINLRIPPEYTSKLLITYPHDYDTETDYECHEILTDYLGNTAHVDELSFIHMEPKDYNFSQTEEFLEFLMLEEEYF